jgi:hypothetical protein
VDWILFCAECFLCFACLFRRHRVASRASHGFGGLVPGLIHKVIHIICGVAAEEFVLGRKTRNYPEVALNAGTPARICSPSRKAADTQSFAKSGRTSGAAMLGTPWSSAA